MDGDDFEIADFLPYMLNRAAEATGQGFSRHYKDRYGMLRTEWRVLFHLGRYGPMTASAICARADLHKTKVSRAVAALESRRHVAREVQEEDRRNATLCLTRSGAAIYADLTEEARRYDDRLAARLTREEARILRSCLARLAERGT
ncbi:MarR family winged helix-turn-helix transcriptional regulator [Roseobacter sp. HKCCA0434]|uniref:MarR family winged helix-turn-helix transcriptional regulator n=1 Tax=Roseobacter sp. HKCCA0434 TaxID=3079297 RepID=UPI002905C398|nr:MarR family transcriptional regulator [Roseobacter sp. HKCCA0434]